MQVQQHLVVPSDVLVETHEPELVTVLVLDDEELRGQCVERRGHLLVGHLVPVEEKWVESHRGGGSLAAKKCAITRLTERRTLRVRLDRAATDRQLADINPGHARRGWWSPGDTCFHDERCASEHERCDDESTAR